MKAKDVAKIIEKFAPIENQESWDNSGFCIGSPDTEIKGILLGFDCTSSLIEEALETGANMIITHHPLILEGIKNIMPCSYKGSLITLAVKNDIVIYSAHTNADKVITGVSGLMADRLNLENREFLDESGLGLIGNLPSPMAVDDFIQYVKKVFSLKHLRTSKPCLGSVSKIAMCGGSGKSLIGKAFQKGADVYISGDLPYHDFFCEKNFMIMDIGHYESEIDILKKIMALLTEKNNNFAVRITKNNNNPIYYY